VDLILAVLVPLDELEAAGAEALIQILVVIVVQTLFQDKEIKVGLPQVIHKVVQAGEVPVVQAGIPEVASGQHMQVQGELVELQM
jgi:hypothetical protein